MEFLKPDSPSTYKALNIKRKGNLVQGIALESIEHINRLTRELDAAKTLARERANEVVKYYCLFKGEKATTDVLYRLINESDEKQIVSEEMKKKEILLDIETKEKMETLLNDPLQIIRKHFSCELCRDICALPVNLKCGHIYCSSCIFRYLRVRMGTSPELRRIPRCPNCRAPFKFNEFHMIKMSSLKDFLDEYKGQMQVRERKNYERRCLLNEAWETLTSRPNFLQEFVNRF